jgi:hypothetical protein
VRGLKEGSAGDFGRRLKEVKMPSPEELAKELVKKYRIELIDDKIMVPRWSRVPEDEKELIIELKPYIIAELKRQREEERERMLRDQAEAKAQRAAVIRGEVKIEVDPRDDTIYPYYAGELLAQLGLAQEVPGFGYVLELFARKELGTSFTYPEALALAERIRKEEEEKQRAKIEAAIEQARRTGKPVLIRKWGAPCNDPLRECSFDIVEEYAHPDGSIKQVRIHTY